MNSYKFKWNPSGYDTLKKSINIQDELKRYADKVASVAGEGFVVEHRKYNHWDGYAIRSDTPKAYARNLNENILEKALRSV